VLTGTAVGVVEGGAGVTAGAGPGGVEAAEGARRTSTGLRTCLLRGPVCTSASHSVHEYIEQVEQWNVAGSSHVEHSSDGPSTGSGAGGSIISSSFTIGLRIWLFVADDSCMSASHSLQKFIWHFVH
jgi:hypothetical protein